MHMFILIAIGSNVYTGVRIVAFWTLQPVISPAKGYVTIYF